MVYSNQHSLPSLQPARFKPPKGRPPLHRSIWAKRRMAEVGDFTPPTAVGMTGDGRHSWREFDKGKTHRKTIGKWWFNGI